MKKQASVIITIIFVFIISITNISCTMELSLQKPTKYPALYSVLVCSVPGTGDRYTRGGKLEIMETDSYGRVLFRHWQVSTYYPTHNNGMWSYVICQKYDENGAFYLRDIDFELTDGDGNIGAESLEDLKQRNGWEQPIDLNADQMRFTDIFTNDRFSPGSKSDNGHYSECGVLRKDELKRKMLVEFLPEIFDSKPELDVKCFDIYNDGRAVYIVRLMRQTSNPSFRSCLIATYSDGRIYEESPLWIDAPFDESYGQQLVQFRAEFEAASGQ